MALELSITNILHLISLMSPILISFFLIMSSLFNLDIKAIIYLMGVLIASIFNIFLKNIIKQGRFEDEAFSCNILDIPYNSQYNSPSSSSVFIAFTMVYLLLPMISNNTINYGVVIFFLCIFCVDTYSKIMKRCTNYAGALFGLVVGFITGIIWYVILDGSGNSDLLYFDELKSNKTLCSRPSKQNFKCKVYKNGEVIGAI